MDGPFDHRSKIDLNFVVLSLTKNSRDKLCTVLGNKVPFFVCAFVNDFGKRCEIKLGPNFDQWSNVYFTEMPLGFQIWVSK